MQDVMSSLLTNNYYIWQDKTKSRTSVVYTDKATTRDILRSYFETSISIYQENSRKRNSKLSCASHTELFEQFVKQLEEKGWNVSAHLLGVGEWRCSL